MTATPWEVRGRYACPVCDRRFFELAEKKAHVRLKHDPKPGKVKR